MMSLVVRNIDLLQSLPGGGTIGHLPVGAAALVLPKLLHDASKAGRPGLVYVASDGQTLPMIAAGLNFFSPGLETVHLPAWDCLPYDRVSPSAEVTARRIAAYSRVEEAKGGEGQPFILLTTVNALVQRMPPLSATAKQSWMLAPGQRAGMTELSAWLAANGFERVSTVRERGEFAVRGGILDLFAPGTDAPVRLDFFGDSLESIRLFDLASQRTTGQLTSFSLAPMSEVSLDEEAMRRFRTGYVEKFGAATREDALYAAISEGRRFAGMEHWLPLFHENLVNGFDLLADFAFAADYQAAEAATARLEQVKDHYQARIEALDADSSAGTPYHPLPPEALYLTASQLEQGLREADSLFLSPFLPGESTDVIDAGGEASHNFGAERAAGQNVFDAVIAYARAEAAATRRVIIACWSEGARSRMGQVLEEHGLSELTPVDDIAGVDGLKKGRIGLAVMPLETGFRLEGLTVIAEQDVLGDRLVRRTARKKAAGEFLSELSALSEGDIVVHVEHGIARFAGLRTIEAAGAPHDCLELRYAGDDRLYLPVENIELLSRYGSAETQVQLDRLGGVAWQARKARLKKQILEMADQLIRIAAERALVKVSPLVSADGAFDEFVARFPYDVTEDQNTAIDAVLDDLARDLPMDRLVCGDVGFGKTEVALRAAFVAAMNGRQVAVVVPTTLLARQHYNTFRDRFRGFPVEVRHVSRLVGAKDMAETRAGLADGTVDIVIGTHALLTENVRFDRLGLLIIDEEQRFGVKHKEKLKHLKADIHVLTLSATPIPRTLQLALTGVRELSLITTAPVDRLAVRTFISPFDPLVVREALLREHFRGGQSFYVCPRVVDLADQKKFLEKHTPELKIAVAHGQMQPRELDDVMNAFYDGRYDVLLSTTIVESGLDIPTANTLIVHRADMFGLAQLYQLRGRVGRSKQRAYALFTLPVRKRLTGNAERRLKVLQSLDSIGAGFELASHDLDIRGSGNLLGEAQSGHVKEVGYELYQQMLEEAVAELRSDTTVTHDREWSPQITLGMPVLIPEEYVSDLNLRLALYRRVADLRDVEAIDAFGEEMIDRFGPMPEEFDHLLRIVHVKGLCRKANIAKLDAGPKGVVISFRNQEFANPAELIRWISRQSSQAKIRPDQSLVLSRDWSTPKKRLQGVAAIVASLAKMAAEAPADA
jgi:transcription-repair coupling factor (superfamily II helicase)